MSLGPGIASISVEGYVSNAVDVDRSGLCCSLRVGTRTLSSREGASDTKSFHFDLEGEDIATLDITDVRAEAAGTARFSLSRAFETGSDRLEVVLLSAKSREPYGFLTLSITWSPTQSASCEAVSSSSASMSSASASAVSPKPQAAEHERPPFMSAQLMRDLELDQGPQPQAPQRSHEEDTVFRPFASSPIVLEESSSGAGCRSPDTTVLPTSDPDESAVSTAPTSMMAAMVAVAAMVAAAADLPAPVSRTTSLGSKGTAPGVLMTSGTGLFPSAPSTAISSPGSSATYYPRIEPYDAVPPFVFGPGQLPTESSKTKTFYPDIAIKLRISDISQRLNELRPTASAPLQFGAR